MLIAAVVFIGVLCAFNLLLTLGIVRRMREQSLATTIGQEPAQTGITAVGSSPDRFRATSTDGRTFSSEELPKWTIVAFFSDSCPVCRDKLATFVRRAQQLRHESQEILGVVVGDERATADMVSRLEKVCSVVIEPQNGPMSTAFGVTRFPSLCLLDEGGAVQATGWDLDSLLTPTGPPTVRF